jgi:phosphatidylserine/phosphatidylglycerophosphate/cardiolipin synthase-like enzyme
MARLVLDPLSPQTCALVITPGYEAMNDLSQVLGKGIVAFVYRNLTKPLAPSPGISPPVENWPEVPLDSYRIKIKQLNIAALPAPELSQQIGQFLAGDLAVEVKAGDKLLLPSTIGGTDNWGHLGFEIVFIPSGLLGEHGWNRLKELIDSTALTRRLDPMSFYARVQAAPAPLNLVADLDHALLTITTRRTLLELRNEYDRPFIGTAYVYDGAQTTPFNFDQNNQGTIELPATTTFSSFEVPYYTSTELPSGNKAQVPAARSFTAPDHWALQVIYMEQNPATADEPQSWFVENAPALPRYTENNKIAPIRDGVEVFRQYAEAIRTLTQPDHFMYLAAWWMDNTFELIAEDQLSTMAQLTRWADSHGAQVRALLWEQKIGGQNASEVYDINHLNGGNGEAILDDHTHDCTTIPRTGSHHQKFLLIYGSQEEEFAFCGGVDINSNRRDSPGHGAIGGYHDVHAKVEGPAVADIHRTFVERWNNHPQTPTTSQLSETTDKFKADAGSVFVQVARTYPLRGANPYPFAPQGLTSPLNAFLRAIQKAQKFIYIEDQYLTPYAGGLPYDENEDMINVLGELRTALLTIDYIIMVIPNHAKQGWLNNIFSVAPGQNRYRRRHFIQGLMEVAPEKIHVFYLAHPGTTHRTPDEVATEGDGPGTSGSPDHPDEIYCHSKVWIIDDVVAKIGSANCNRRSYTHDSEMDIVMVDGALDNGARRFARNFRLELWAEHLGVPESEKGLLEDHKLALHYWLAEGRLASAHIRDYDVKALGIGIGTTFWDTYVDPYGIF